MTCIFYLVIINIYSQLQTADDRVQELDTANKELTDHKYRSEAAIRELKTKLKSSEEVVM